MKMTQRRKTTLNHMARAYLTAVILVFLESMLNKIVFCEFMYVLSKNKYDCRQIRSGHMIQGRLPPLGHLHFLMFLKFSD